MVNIAVSHTAARGSIPRIGIDFRLPSIFLRCERGVVHAYGYVGSLGEVGNASLLNNLDIHGTSHDYTCYAARSQTVG